MLGDNRSFISGIYKLGAIVSRKLPKNWKGQKIICRMRTIIIVIFIVILPSCFLDPTSNIYDGLPIDIIQLDKTVDEAIEKYGEESNFIQGIACGADTAWHVNYFYFNNGIVIISTTIEGSELDHDLRQSKIEEIGILYPANVTTNKGINIKDDSLPEIIEMYGKPEKNDTNKISFILHYFSQGISFDCNRKDKSIERIAIYKKGEVPDFSYYSKTD